MVGIGVMISTKHLKPALCGSEHGVREERERLVAVLEDARAAADTS